MNFSEPLPFEEAIEFLTEKKILPTTLGSQALRDRLHNEVRRRAVFSARMTQASVLQKISDVVTKVAGGLTQSGATAGEGGEDDPMMSIAEAKAQIKEALDRLNYQASPDDENTIKDFTSDARLQLIVETNVLDAQGHGRWQAGQDETALDVNPAWELVRMITPMGKPRDWEARWADALNATTIEGATPPGSGRMVALKNHPIWQALGDGAGGYEDTLGNPWPPFAFNSGMNVVDVPRDEAIALGLMEEGTRVPSAEEMGLNEELTGDATKFDPALQQALAADPELTIRDGKLTLSRR